MALTGRFHPLLVHFPIALVLIAAVAELVFLTTEFPELHTVAVANIRAGATFAVASAGAGWILASSRIVEASPALEWHRWLGAAAAGAAGPAPLGAPPKGRPPPPALLFCLPIFLVASLDAAGVPLL